VGSSSNHYLSSRLTLSVEYLGYIRPNGCDHVLSLSVLFIVFPMGLECLFIYVFAKRESSTSTSNKVAGFCSRCRTMPLFNRDKFRPIKIWSHFHEAYCIMSAKRRLLEHSRWITQ